MSKMLLRKTQIKDLVSDLAALAQKDADEKARAEAAEAALAADLAAEVTRATTKEGELEAAIAAEQARAEAAELVLTNNLAAEVTRASDEEARIEGKHDAYVLSNDAALAAEVTRATGAESTLQSNIDAEVTRAQSAEGALDLKINTEISDRVAAVSAEETARIAGDANLQSQIDFITSNVDQAALDSLTEVVTAFQAADTNINQAISDLSSTASTDRAAIRTEFAAADSDVLAHSDGEDDKIRYMIDNSGSVHKDLHSGTYVEEGGMMKFGPFPVYARVAQDGSSVPAHVFGQALHLNGQRLMWGSGPGDDWKFEFDTPNGEFYVLVSDMYLPEVQDGSDLRFSAVII